MGRRSAAEERARADTLFAQGEHGNAKLTYDRAIDACTPADSALADECRARVIECCDAIARTRIAEADRLIEQGAHDLALPELQNAALTARSQALLLEIERRIEKLDAAEAIEAGTVAELSDDERFELISGSFEAEQHDEYVSLGEPMRRALLLLHGGDAKSALPLLEQLHGAPDARYLWLELGRARLLCDDSAGGREALEKFLALLEPGAGGDARLGAHIELAALANEAGDIEGAIGQHQAALEALPDDPRPYIALARFLRRSGMPEEALDVLESATEALESESPQLLILVERGLAHADLNADEAAIEVLEQAVSLLTTRQHLDLPPELATKLAELHERAGNRARALDLYSLLTQGSDVANHASYYRQTGRLFLALDRPADARRALQRALALTEESSPAHAEIASALAKIT